MGPNDFARISMEHRHIFLTIGHSKEVIRISVDFNVYVVVNDKYLLKC